MTHAARSRRLAFGLASALLLAFPAARAETPVAASPFEVQLQSRTFTPPAALETAAVLAQSSGERVHHYIQFHRIPRAADRKQMQSNGVRVLNYVAGRTYVASSTVQGLNSLSRNANVRWAGPIAARDKIGAGVAAGRIPSWADTGNGRLAATIQVHPDVSVAEAATLARRHGGRVIASVRSIPAVTAIIPVSSIASIAAEDAVQFVDAAPPALDEHNDGVIPALTATPLAIAPYNLSGAGVTALVYDSGMVDTAHTDFTGRVLELDGDASETVRNHSTHVSGTVLGSGANSTGNDSAGNPNGGTANQWQGVAPAANLRSFGSSGSTDVLYDSAGDINADFTTAMGNGIDLATMSLGNNVVPNGLPCGQLGDYTNTAILIDQIVGGSIGGQQLVWTQSAGNERTQGAPCGTFGSISSPATSKNSMVIGAVNSNDNSMTTFSSWGPTDDGRLKPDLVGPGCQSNGDNNVTSTGFDDDGDGNLEAGEVQNAYVTMCGTSMATPAVAGTNALLIQQWRALFGGTPLGHTVKAILIQTATDLGNAGPDYQFGWGNVNAQAAVDLVRAEALAELIHVNSVDQGDEIFYTFNSDGSAAPRITIAWSDPAAARASVTQLVNDLDVRLTDPDGIVTQPFILNAGSPNNAATRGNDALNNVEGILATGAKAGTWTVRVSGTTVPSGPQQYTLITPSDAAEDNQPPVADAGGPYATVEGTDVVVDAGGSTDPDGDALTYAWDLDNDGAFDDATGQTATFDLVGQDGAFTIGVRVTDSNGAFDTDTGTVNVANVAPSVAVAPVTPSDENAAFSLGITVSDPGWLETLSLTVDWGDGAGAQPVAGTLENVRPNATLVATAPHTYGDNGIFAITVCGADDDVSTCSLVPFQVDNVDPTAAIDLSGAVNINGTPTFVTQIGVPLALSGTSTDPGSDDLSLGWDWDDGATTTTAYLVNPPLPDPPLSPSIQPRNVGDTQSHTYTDACMYTVAFQATDDDGGTSPADTVAVLIAGNADQERSAGYWKSQYAGRGSDDFSAETLACYLEIVQHVSQVFSEVTDASTAAAALAVLSAPPNGDMKNIFDRQLLAALLNFANGAYTLDEMVDTNGDGTADTAFGDVIDTAEGVRLDPGATSSQLEAQKNILESLNV